MDSAPVEDFDGWIGKERIDEDVVSPGRARALAATLDRTPDGLGDGRPLPPGWHWIAFHSSAAHSALGPDGHERRGSFLPPIPLPRRMWAGGRLHFRGPLMIGESIRRVSTVQSVERKEGRSGTLYFVTVRHLISNDAGVRLEEEQDLVYRAPTRGSGPGGSGRQGPGTAGHATTWSEPYVADEVTLFRFSALTFNGHRIHYDHPYATSVEGYPGLVVHGPLVALLLLEAGLRHAHTDRARPPEARSYQYRALAPLFCNEELHLCGAPAEDAGAATTRAHKLWAVRPGGVVATEAELEVG
jgi:3-methylfumaryl-CoA hydratase